MISVHLMIMVMMCAAGNVQLYSMDISIAEVQSSVVCDHGRFLCPDGETCCPMKNEMFGCCPFPDAVCCSDGIHCVPHDNHCSTSTDAFLLIIMLPAVHTQTQNQKATTKPSVFTKPFWSFHSPNTMSVVGSQPKLIII